MSKSSKIKKFDWSPYLKDIDIPKTSISKDPYTTYFEVRLPYQNEGSILSFNHVVAAEIFTTYARTLDGKIFGDPICDSLLMEAFSKRFFLGVIADGCNWGVGPQMASRLACSSVRSYLVSKFNDIDNIRKLAKILVDAIRIAHDKIITTFEQDLINGTTTVLSCAVVPVKEKDPKSEFAIVCCSLGDCRAFLYRKAQDLVVELTTGSKGNAKNSSDCGGRIGTHDLENNPDLRNLKTFYKYCSAGDILLLLSDGVHDNLDPEVLGIPPKYGESWDILPPDEIMTQKNIFTTDFLKYICKSSKSVEEIVESLHAHCMEKTDRGRNYIEENPLSPHPNSYEDYPGKMDHATILAYKISVNLNSFEGKKPTIIRNENQFNKITSYQSASDAMFLKIPSTSNDDREIQSARTPNVNWGSHVVKGIPIPKKSDDRNKNNRTNNVDIENIETENKRIDSEDDESSKADTK